jgi:hypothetical protein
MPLTAERYEQSLSAPPLCEQLRIRDLLENVAVQVDGALVAGYEVGGIQSYYASDEGRNRIKGLLEALVRSLSAQNPACGRDRSRFCSRASCPPRNSRTTFWLSPDRVRSDMWMSDQRRGGRKRRC